MSTWYPYMCLYCERSLVITVSSVFGSISHIMSLAPFRATMLPMISPIPEAPPVIRTVLSFIWLIWGNFLLCKNRYRIVCFKIKWVLKIGCVMDCFYNN